MYILQVCVWPRKWLVGFQSGGKATKVTMIVGTPRWGIARKKTHVPPTLCRGHVLKGLDSEWLWQWHHLGHVENPLVLHEGDHHEDNPLQQTHHWRWAAAAPGGIQTGQGGAWSWHWVPISHLPTSSERHRELTINVRWPVRCASDSHVLTLFINFKIKI